MEITQVANTASFDQQVAKNKRKKFNPKFMLTNSSDDDEREDSVEKDDDDSNENQASKDELKSLSKNNNDSPPPSNLQNPFMSPSKLSLLQTIGNLQQHQQTLFQQAALSAVVPQFAQNMNPGMNLSEAEAKFREFAFKTMQELLNIYGLGLSSNDIVDALKQQQPQPVGKCL
jgi:hypothetical protein